MDRTVTKIRLGMGAFLDRSACYGFIYVEKRDVGNMRLISCVVILDNGVGGLFRKAGVRRGRC